MGKIYAIYAAALCCLFIALLVVFWALGLGKGTPVTQLAPEPITDEVTIEERMDETIKKVPMWSIVFAKLYENISYYTPKNIILYEHDRDEPALEEVMPSGGIFLVDTFQMRGDKGWYKVIVNNGVSNYFMYIKQEDIDPYDPVVYGAPPTAEQIELRQRIYKSAQRMVRGGSERSLELEAMAALQDQPDDIEQLTSSVQELVKNVNSKGIALPIMIAAGMTISLAFFIVFIMKIKHMLFLGTGYTIDELYSPESEEQDDYTDEEANEYGNIQADDPMENSEYDLPKSPFE